MHTFDTDLPRALVDMDGVLADFDAQVHQLVRENYPDIQPLEPMPEPPDFYSANNYPKQHYRVVRDLSNQKGFFASLPVIDGAIDGWRQLLHEGFQPQICSSPIGSNPYSEQEKLDWLDQHLVPFFGAWVVETAIITKEKHAFPGAVLIDDRPEIPHADLASWEHVVFDQPCNRGITRKHFRVRGWGDPSLGTILRQAAQLEQPAHQ
ncbi:MAG: 5' nucleotidase, NT5C type [Candidatus Saccharibacteria bacterium]